MANIFPDIVIPERQVSSTVTYGKELAFDFVTGEFIMQDGAPRVLTGIDALKMWIEKTIRTVRFRFPVYSFSYGCELDDIVGYDLPRVVLESEVPRAIREALIYDDRISDVRDFVVERGGDWLKVTFTVVTFDGTIYSQEVTF